jgi:hypothetical protein
VFRFRLGQEIVLFSKSSTATHGDHSASYSRGTARERVFSRLYNGSHSPPSSAKVTCTMTTRLIEGRLRFKLDRISQSRCWLWLGRKGFYSQRTIFTCATASRLGLGHSQLPPNRHRMLLRHEDSGKFLQQDSSNTVIAVFNNPSAPKISTFDACL